MGADGHEHLAGQPLKEAIHMTKEWRSDQEIEDNPRFGLHARVNAINMKAMLELQVL